MNNYMLFAIIYLIIGMSIMLLATSSKEAMEEIEEDEFALVMIAGVFLWPIMLTSDEEEE